MSRKVSKIYDVLIKNGTVIDPSQGIHEVSDVAISRGRIAEMRRGINSSEARYVIDASGMVVTPGLVDIHVHCCYRILHFAVDPDLTCLAKGATTVLDAGSTGELNFLGFREYVMERAETRIFALLNIESLGMIEYSRAGQKWPSLITGRDEVFINIDGTLEVLSENRDVVLGIKWAHHGLRGLELAREAADRAGCLLMAENHHQPEALKYMRRGDVITHLYHGVRIEKHDGLLDGDWNVQPEFFEAVKRGVILDVGHGAQSFRWPVAERGIEQGIKPDTISTDLHLKSFNGPAYDMPTTMSKFLHLGLSIEEVIRASATRPAEALGMAGSIGTLKPGASGDVAVLKLLKGKFPLFDVEGEGRICRERLITMRVIKNGKLIF